MPDGSVFMLDDYFEQ
jgi:hypothetical protein